MGSNVEGQTEESPNNGSPRISSSAFARIQAAEQELMVAREKVAGLRSRKDGDKNNSKRSQSASNEDDCCSKSSDDNIDKSSAGDTGQKGKKRKKRSRSKSKGKDNAKKTKHR